MSIVFTTTALATLLFILSIIGIGIGVLMNRPPIKGSCGGCANCVCKRKPS